MLANYLLVLILFITQITADKRAPSAIGALLKKSDRVFKQDHAQGIQIARQAYQYALKENDKIYELKSLNRVSEFLWENYDYKNARLCINESLKSAKISGIDSLTGDAYVLSGLIYFSEKQFETAITAYQQAIVYYQKQGLKKRLGITYLDLGICEKNLSRWETANYYYFKAAEIFQQLKNDNQLADTYNSIGNCFSSLKRYDKAIEYHKKSLEIRARQHDAQLMAESFNNIGYAYKQNNQSDSALHYLLKSLEAGKAKNDSSSIVLTLQNLGSSFKMKGDLKNAERYILRSLQIAIIYKMEEETARGNLDLAELYLSQGKYQEALHSVSITENTAVKLGIPELLVGAYTVKYDLYQKNAYYKRALYYSNNKNNAISELEIRYQTRQKEKDIATLNLQNKLGQSINRQQKFSIILLIILTIILLLLFIFAYRSFRIKHTANKRIQTLMRDLHHRVKNNLQILSGLFSMQIDSLTDEDTKNALRENESRLTAMNLIHSKLYLDNITTQIEINEYLTKLLHHIKSSFGGNQIKLRIEVDQMMIEADKAVAIGLIINELATNAFKYAFDGKAGEIFLSLRQESKCRLVLILKDTGKGIETDNLAKKQSFGLKLANLMALQLNSTLNISSDAGASYEMKINI
jgi:two-component sensor histidine kinase